LKRFKEGTLSEASYLFGKTEIHGSEDLFKKKVRKKGISRFLVKLKNISGRKKNNSQWSKIGSAGSFFVFLDSLFYNFTQI
jgi:hypothetical protein